MIKRVDYEPGQWGPPAWQFLHTITFGYPDDPDEEIKEDFWQFFRSLQQVLPCANCRRHYRKKLRQAEALRHTLKDPFASRGQLSRWVVELHNAVNKQTHKKNMSYKDVYDMFNDNTKLCTSPQSTSLLQTERDGGDEEAVQEEVVVAAAAPRKPRMPSSRIALIMFIVLVLLFLTIAVLAYLGCSCGSKKMGR